MLSKTFLHPNYPDRLIFCSLPKNLRQINATDANAKGLQKFFAVPSGVEGVWSGADGAQSSALHSVDNPANRHKCVQIRFERIALRKNGVPFRDAERDAVLIKVIANGDFSAKGVTTPIQRKASQIIRVCLDQDRNVQSRKLNRVGDTLFIAEVGVKQQGCH